MSDPNTHDDTSDHEHYATLKRICPKSGGYKIVFLSSDSAASGPDDGDDSETSSHTAQSECDWDYFESFTASHSYSLDDMDGAAVARLPPPPPPPPPPHSHTADDYADIYGQLSRLEHQFRHLDGGASDVGSDGGIGSCAQAACDCGHQPTYIPILVPVPILIPNKRDKAAASSAARRYVDDATHTRASAAYTSTSAPPYACVGGGIQAHGPQQSTKHKRTKSKKSAHTSCGGSNTNADRIYMHTCKPLQSHQYNHTQKRSLPCTVSAVQMSDCNIRDVGDCRNFGRTDNGDGDARFTMAAASQSELVAEQVADSARPGDEAPDCGHDDTADGSRAHASYRSAEVSSRQARSSREIADYSGSENAASTSSCDSDTTDEPNHSSGTGSGAGGGESTRQSYDLVRPMDGSECSSDGDELLMGSGRDQPSTSSAVEASESDDAADRVHGLVHAEKRPKSKSFYKVFVVNKAADSSDSDSPSTNVNSTDDSSDNDTDTERDCGIVLNYIKSLPEPSAIDRDAVHRRQHGDASNSGTATSCSAAVVVDGVALRDDRSPTATNDTNEQQSIENVPNRGECDELAHNYAVKEAKFDENIRCADDSGCSAAPQTIVMDDEVSKVGQSPAKQTNRMHCGTSEYRASDVGHTGNGDAENVLSDSEISEHRRLGSKMSDSELLASTQSDTSSANPNEFIEHGTESDTAEQHNHGLDDSAHSSLADYFTRSLEADVSIASPTKTMTKRRPIVTKHHESDISSPRQQQQQHQLQQLQQLQQQEQQLQQQQQQQLQQMQQQLQQQRQHEPQPSSSDRINDESAALNDFLDAPRAAAANDAESSEEALSAEVTDDGLADDDSWVDSADESEPEYSEAIPMCSTAPRDSLDFTLHTIVEESCDESEADADKRKSVSELERYYFFGLADGKSTDHRDESVSDTSSLCSENADSIDTAADSLANDEDMMSSRLEKYFLSTFLTPQLKVTQSSRRTTSIVRPHTK